MATQDQRQEVPVRPGDKASSCQRIIEHNDRLVECRKYCHHDGSLCWRYSYHGRQRCGRVDSDYGCSSCRPSNGLGARNAAGWQLDQSGIHYCWRNVEHWLGIPMRTRTDRRPSISDLCGDQRGGSGVVSRCHFHRCVWKLRYAPDEYGKSAGHSSDDCSLSLGGEGHRFQLVKASRQRTGFNFGVYCCRPWSRAADCAASLALSALK